MDMDRQGQAWKCQVAKLGGVVKTGYESVVSLRISGLIKEKVGP